MKTINIIRHEFIQSLESLINDSGLPAFAMADVLEDAAQSCRAAALAQLQKDLQAQKEEEV